MRKYDEEFKREAIKKIHDGQTVASVARELGCGESAAQVEAANHRSQF
jgi:transposase-like protein